MTERSKDLIEGGGQVGEPRSLGRVRPQRIDYADHIKADHSIDGPPYERMRRILARHLCGWISGHGAPLDHFLADADMILGEAHREGIRFHLIGRTGSSLDGFVSFERASTTSPPPSYETKLP